MGVLDWPEQAAGQVWALFRENFRTFIILGVFVYLTIEAGFVDAPEVGFSVPIWARVLGTFALLAAVGGHWVGAKLISQTEPDWQYIHVYNEDDPSTPKVLKVTPEVVREMEIFGGRRLYSPQGADNHFVCRYFNEDVENPVAHVTWKDVPADSELLGTKPSAIEDEIVALRDTYEDTHGKYRWVLDHLFMVVRRLDFRRTESQNEVLEDHVTPSREDERITGILKDVMPDELQPDRLQGATDGRASDPEEEVEETVDDMGPDPEKDTTELTVAADGGEKDE